MPKVLIVEPDERVRHGLIELLEALPGVSAVGAAGPADQPSPPPHAGPCDAVVLAIWSSVERALDGVRRLRQEQPTLPVVVVGFSLDPCRLGQCVDLGVAGYVAAEDILDEFAPAVQAALAGATYFSQAAAHALAQSPSEHRKEVRGQTSDVGLSATHPTSDF